MIIEQVMDKLDEWKETYGLKNWYLRDKEEYIDIHIYFKNSRTFITLGNYKFGIEKMLRKTFKAIESINEILSITSG